MKVLVPGKNGFVTYNRWVSLKYNKKSLDGSV
uniref:Uncharacterized protein n=1 Tax=Arundo donax TaxID=35708 RepID=A0A0A8YZ48_ARUDO